MAGMDKSTRNLLLVIGAIWLFTGGLGDGTAPAGNNAEAGNNAGTVTGCAYAPTFTLEGQDKWDTTVGISTAHLYKLNGGTTQTYTAAVEGKFGDTIKVLWGDGNATIYNQVMDYTINQCGKNILANKELVQNTSFTVQCYNEENNLIGVDSTENETIDAGDTVSLDCEIRGVNKKGMPHGGVIVFEQPKTYFDEEDAAITGLGGTTDVPAAYTVTNTAMSARAWTVNPVMGSGKVDFAVDVQADSTNDPLSAATTGDMFLKLYSNDCFENSDTGIFECDVVTEDASWAGDQVGQETIEVD